MTFEIIAVGTELLLGQIVNTNAQYISCELSDMGFNLYYTTVVGDNPDRLKAALAVAADRADAVITTGGLGPTKDDLTKETIAEFCGKKCVMHEESRKKIEERFARIPNGMPKSNLKQAEMPEGCIVLENNNGTAPGAIIESEKGIFIMLPGPPSEMKLMFESGVRPYLASKMDSIIVSHTLRVFGIGESAAAEELGGLLDNQNPTVAPYAKTGEVELRLTAKAESAEKAEEMIEPVEQKVRDILGDKIYGMGGDNSLENVVVSQLLKKGLKMTSAESCTGGMVMQKITSIPGASKCFDCGFVTYSNEQKTRILGVSSDTLNKFGAVSEQTALEMSEGARKASHADIAVSITGIAGPDGGSAEKPVGLVYISVCCDKVHKAVKLELTGDRESIRTRAAMHALDLIRRNI